MAHYRQPVYQRLNGIMRMDLYAQLDELLQAADKVGIEVRAEPLGGDGGGLCTIKGHRVLFLDTSADVGTRFERTCQALAPLPDISQLYLHPEVRSQLERFAEP